MAGQVFLTDNITCLRYTGKTGCFLKTQLAHSIKSVNISTSSKLPDCINNFRTHVVLIPAFRKLNSNLMPH